MWSQVIQFSKDQKLKFWLGFNSNRVSIGQGLVKGYEGKQGDGAEGDYSDAIASQVLFCPQSVYVKF